MTLMQRRRALMATATGIPGTVIAIPQSCTKANQAFTIWQSIVSNNTTAGFYFTTKKRIQWQDDMVVCVLLTRNGSILSIMRIHDGKITGVANDVSYDAIMTQGDTFYFVEAGT